MTIYRLSILHFCLLSIGNAAAGDAARIRDMVDGAIKPMMAAHDVPGMAVAVTIDGRAYYFNSGLASREEKYAGH